MHLIEILAEVETPVLQAKALEGMRFEYKISSHRFSSGGVSLDLFEFYFAIGLSSQATAMILYDLVKKHARKRPRKITINRQEITFDKAEIEKLIEERIARKMK